VDFVVDDDDDCVMMKMMMMMMMMKMMSVVCVEFSLTMHLAVMRVPRTTQKHCFLASTAIHKAALACK